MQRFASTLPWAILVITAGWISPLGAQEALEELEQEVRAQVADEPVAAPAPQEAGWLGIQGDDRLDEGRGVRITALVPGGPADSAGLRRDDLITAIEQQSITTTEQASQILANKHPGDAVQFEVRREETVERITVTLGRRPAEELPAEQLPDMPPPSELEPQVILLGVGVMPVPDAVADAMVALLQMPRARGAFVQEVKSGSPAQAAGVEVGSVILAFNGQRVDTPEDLERYVMQSGFGKNVKLALFTPHGLAERQVTLGTVDQAQPAADMEVPPDGDFQLGRLSALEQRLELLERRLANIEALLTQPQEKE